MTIPKKDWQRAILPSDATLQQAIRKLDDAAVRIALVLNESGKLDGTITDGDIRRGLLKGISLDCKITPIVNRAPLVVRPGISREFIVQLMLANKVQQIPEVDDENILVGLHLWDEGQLPVARPNMIVIMAGGFGTRLRPHTETCPKPMLPIAGKPMLEHIIERAKSEGFSHFVLAIHYLGEMIEEYFKDGSQLDVRIEYLRESKPLGTAGALSLLRAKPSIPFIITNGDLITDIRFGELLDFHIRQDAVATMAVRPHEWQHPFGVVQMKGVEIVGFEEKPVMRSHINAGVYALEPEVLDVLHADQNCDMPTLFEQLQMNQRRTVGYPMYEPWLDVGRPDDLEKINLEKIKKVIKDKR